VLDGDCSDLCLMVEVKSFEAVLLGNGGVEGLDIHGEEEAVWVGKLEVVDTA